MSETPIGYAGEGEWRQEPEEVIATIQCATCQHWVRKGTPSGNSWGECIGILKHDPFGIAELAEIRNPINLDWPDTHLATHADFFCRLWKGLWEDET